MITTTTSPYKAVDELFHLFPLHPCRTELMDVLYSFLANSFTIKLFPTRLAPSILIHHENAKIKLAFSLSKLIRPHQKVEP